MMYIKDVPYQLNKGGDLNVRGKEIVKNHKNEGS